MAEAKNPVLPSEPTGIVAPLPTVLSHHQHIRHIAYSGPCSICDLPIDVGARIYSYCTLGFSVIYIALGAYMVAEIEHNSADEPYRESKIIFLCLNSFCFTLGSVILLFAVLWEKVWLCRFWIGITCFYFICWIIVIGIADGSKITDIQVIIMDILGVIVLIFLYPIYGIWVVLQLIRWIKQHSLIQAEATVPTDPDNPPVTV